jgi:hypothetical protein
LDLAAALARVNKNVVLVLCQGRPRLFTRVLDSVAAVLYAYLPGPNAGTAIANILFGDANPFVIIFNYLFGFQDLSLPADLESFPLPIPLNQQEA